MSEVKLDDFSERILEPGRYKRRKAKDEANKKAALEAQGESITDIIGTSDPAGLDASYEEESPSVAPKINLQDTITSNTSAPLEEGGEEEAVVSLPANEEMGKEAKKVLSSHEIRKDAFKKAIDARNITEEEADDFQARRDALEDKIQAAQDAHEKGINKLAWAETAATIGKALFSWVAAKKGIQDTNVPFNYSGWTSHYNRLDKKLDRDLKRIGAEQAEIRRDEAQLERTKELEARDIGGMGELEAREQEAKERGEADQAKADLRAEEKAAELTAKERKAAAAAASKLEGQLGKITDVDDLSDVEVKSKILPLVPGLTSEQYDKIVEDSDPDGWTWDSEKLTLFNEMIRAAQSGESGEEDFEEQYQRAVRASEAAGQPVPTREEVKAFLGK